MNAPESVATALAALRDRPDSTPLLPSIDVPTLVIAGDEDVVTPTAEAETLHRGIAGSALVILPGVGHLSNLEDPLAWNRALHQFLK
jgi:3-oxoadipate enol-lactonase